MTNKQYVGFWDRFHATIVTVLLLTLIEMIVSYVLLDDFWMTEIELFGIYDIIIGYILPMVITVIFWMKFSSDPGKMLYKAEIVDATTYKKPTLKQFIIRYIGYYISLLPLGMGYWWVIWDKRKQAWHDKMANTLVLQPIKENNVRWYTTLYRVIISFFMVFTFMALMMYFVIPQDKPLQKNKDVDKETLNYLLENNYIEDNNDFLYYEKSSAFLGEAEMITLIKKEGICEVQVKVPTQECYAYKDIGKLEIVYEDYDDTTEVLLYDASEYADAYYDDNITYDGLYSYVTLAINEKNEFNSTMMKLWKNAQPKVK